MINVGKVKRGHQHFLATLDREIGGATQPASLTQIAQRYVASNPPPRVQTGALVAKTQAKVVRTARGKIIKLRNTAPHAEWQEYGTGIYGPRRRRIYPKRARFLRFIARDGSIVFARSVRGTKPTRFLYNASDALARTLGPVIRSAMRRAARRF